MIKRLILISALPVLLGACEQALSMAIPVPRLVEDKTSLFFGSATVDMTIQNTGAGGIVFIWIEQNGQVLCPKRSYFSRDERRRVKFNCPGMQTGRYMSRLAPEAAVEDNIKAQAGSL